MPLNVGYDLIMSPDGKIYVCGTSGMGGMYPRDFILVRFTAEGMLDASFNTTGYVITSIGPDWDEANGLGMQPDGKIVLAGFAAFTNNDLVVARYLNEFTPAAVRSEEAAVQSVDFDLRIIQPNPFTAGTSVAFTLSDPADVQLVVYDAGGRQVANLIHGVIRAGPHVVPWNGRDGLGRHVAAGCYYAQISVFGTNAVRTAKLILAR
jgi:uncharacterized delta-60 repeat protein